MSSPERRSWAAQALLLRHYWQAICVGRMKKQFCIACLQIGDFRSFSEAGRMQKIKGSKAFAAAILLIVITYYLESVWTCGWYFFHLHLNNIEKVAPHLETGSALVPTSPSLLFHTLLSYFICPRLHQVGPALWSILKAPYNYTDIIYRAIIKAKKSTAKPFPTYRSPKAGTEA